MALYHKKLLLHRIQESDVSKRFVINKCLTVLFSNSQYASTVSQLKTNSGHKVTVLSNDCVQNPEEQFKYRHLKSD